MAFATCEHLLARSSEPCGDCWWYRSLAQQVLCAGCRGYRCSTHGADAGRLRLVSVGVLMLFLAPARLQAFRVFLPRWRGSVPPPPGAGGIDPGYTGSLPTTHFCQPLCFLSHPCKPSSFRRLRTLLRSGPPLSPLFSIDCAHFLSRRGFTASLPSLRAVPAVQQADLLNSTRSGRQIRLDFVRRTKYCSTAKRPYRGQFPSLEARPCLQLGPKSTTHLDIGGFPPWSPRSPSLSSSLC
jgi:hypothetical protein